VLLCDTSNGWHHRLPKVDACRREQWTLKTEQRKLKASAGVSAKAEAPILSSIRRTTTSVLCHPALTSPTWGRLGWRF